MTPAELITAVFGIGIVGAILLFIAISYIGG